MVSAKARTTIIEADRTVLDQPRATLRSICAKNALISATPITGHRKTARPVRSVPQADIAHFRSLFA